MCAPQLMPELLSVVVQEGAQRHNSVPVTLDVLSVLHLQSGACWSLQALEPGRLPARRVDVVRHMVLKEVALRPAPRAAADQESKEVSQDE